MTVVGGAVVSGMERFVFKGVASNMVTYLTEVMKMGNSAAAKTVNTWCGFTSMLPLLVAPLADSYWDRYSTILASAFLYVMVPSLTFLFPQSLFLKLPSLTFLFPQSLFLKFTSWLSSPLTDIILFKLSLPDRERFTL